MGAENYTPYTSGEVFTVIWKDVKPTRHQGELPSDRDIPDHLKKPGWAYQKGKKR